jgi:precorrin-6A/cobalt-precorrin-6A reductase
VARARCPVPDAGRPRVTQGGVLILGGTAEARELASSLHAGGVAVTSSLAGRVRSPRLPPGDVRIGGFGGPRALACWIAEHAAPAVVDATHPFAERISVSAVQACELADVPLLRLERPGWTEQDGDRWHWVAGLADAAAAIPALGRRVLLTTGRQGLPAFAGIADAWFLIRCVDPPEPPLPPHHELLLDRGPHALAGELALIDAHRIDLVVTKDSGGPHTAAKLAAARCRDLPVIVVRRPPRARVTTALTVDAALAWVRAQPG